MQKQKANNADGKKELGLIIGATALVALASTYFLYGSKQAPKNRAKVKGWMLKAKGEVLEKLETLQDANEERYNAVVDTVVKKYSQLKSIDTTEVEALGKDMKKHWNSFKKELQKGGSKGKKVASSKVK